MTHRIHALLSIALLTIVGAVSAQDARYQPTPERDFVNATGRAEIIYNDEYSARVRALRDAIAEASLQGSVQVRSTQAVENGRLSVNRLRVQSAARVSDVEILSEGPSNGFYVVDIQARVSSEETCANHVMNDFSKSLAVTNFPLQTPAEATEGHLGSVDRALAGELAAMLSAQRSVRPLNAGQLRLLPTAESAPTRRLGSNELTRAMTMADQLGTQFVLSGVIRDLSVYRGRPDDQDTNSLGALLRQLPGMPRHRNLVIDVFLHDGLTGQLVSETRYATHGQWPFASDDIIGFPSPEFYQSDFGQQAQTLINQIASDVAGQLRCQPFVSRIARVDGQRITVPVGAETGLRPGDDLGLYRTSDGFARDQDRLQTITDTRLVGRVVQVQPDLAIVEIPVGASQLNLQADDLVFAW